MNQLNKRNTKKLNILVLQEYAINKGGKLLTCFYTNSSTKMLWECAKEHSWEACWNDIRSSRWCPHCAGHIRASLQSCKELAKLKQGYCLSTEYINNNSLLIWQCSLGHVWKSSRCHIKQGSWCPTCVNKAKPTINQIKKFAKALGGSLLSSKYVNNRVKLLWRCKENHSWVASWKDINGNNSWCPECSAFKTEKKVKSLLEKKLDITFNKTRFRYDNKRYEFDGYNKEYKIAFEYHGYQHYVYPNYFHKTKELYFAAQQRDKVKEQYCTKNGIKLIIIPYTKEKELEMYIAELKVEKYVTK